MLKLGHKRLVVSNPLKLRACGFLHDSFYFKIVYKFLPNAYYFVMRNMWIQMIKRGQKDEKENENLLFI